MKKTILMVAAMGMMGGALAASSTVNQPLSATVSNVCTYAVDSQDNVDGRTYDQGNKDLGTSNALASVNSTIDMGNLFIFRCTSGTPFAIKDAGSELTLAGTGTANQGKTLKVQFNITTSDQLDTVNGDIHSAGAQFTIPKGQWQASAGQYNGKLQVVVNYN